MSDYMQELCKILNGRTDFKPAIDPGERCALVFSRQKQFGKYALAALEALQKKDPIAYGRISDIVHHNPDDTDKRPADLPLQAADLIANRGYKVLDRGIHGKPQITEDDTWDARLIGEGNVLTSVCNAEEVLKTALHEKERQHNL